MYSKSFADVRQMQAYQLPEVAYRDERCAAVIWAAAVKRRISCTATMMDSGTAGSLCSA